MSAIGIAVVLDPSGRAKCVTCRVKIAKDSTAIALVHWYSGDRVFMHRACAEKIILTGGSHADNQHHVSPSHSI
jgi:hypothetical protein